VMSNSHSRERGLHKFACVRPWLGPVLLWRQTRDIGLILWL
jgi:hypothetical protein